MAFGDSSVTHTNYFLHPQLNSSNDGIFISEYCYFSGTQLYESILFVPFVCNELDLLTCSLSDQTVFPKSGPPQHDIHYWLGNDTNKV